MYETVLIIVVTLLAFLCVLEYVGRKTWEPKIHIVGLSGGIGAGKSTLLKRIKQTGMLQKELPDDVHLEVVQEPSALWRERGWLADFYADPSGNALAFQYLVFATHIRAVKDAINSIRSNKKHWVILVDRSMYDNRLFWELQVENGCKSANKLGNEAYMMLWHDYNNFLPAKPCLQFFFQTSDVQRMMQRMFKRAHIEETGSSSGSEPNSLRGSMEPIQEVQGVTVEYQERLLEKHREYFPEPFGINGVRCKHLNADKPYHEEDGSLHELCIQMANSIKEILL